MTKTFGRTNFQTKTMSENVSVRRKPQSKHCIFRKFFDYVYLSKCANITAILSSLQQGRLIKTLDSVVAFAGITSKINCAVALGVSIHALFTLFSFLFTVKVCGVFFVLFCFFAFKLIHKGDCAN